MTTTRFFVIGSWAEGMMHFQKIKPFIVSIKSARIKGKVFRLPVGFPVIVSEQDSGTDADEIFGQLLEVKYDETLISLLDSFHGVHHADESKGIHYRRSIQVVASDLDDVTDDPTTDAFIYFYNPKKLSPKAQMISGGKSWIDRLQSEPPLTEQLNERQRSYVLKLGAAKPRDIVPINDLSLYRELMKLGLIVDKGRRLALSALGKEVYQHLYLA